MHIEAHHIAAHLHSNAGRKTLLAADFINFPFSSEQRRGSPRGFQHGIAQPGRTSKTSREKKKSKKKLSWERLSPFEVR